MTEQSNEAPGLLPCPFCGAAPETGITGAPECDNWRYVKCSNDYCPVRFCLFSVKGWNTRARVPSGGVGAEKLCVLCGHNGVAPDGTCMVNVQACSDESHNHWRRCGCKCRFPAPTPTSESQSDLVSEARALLDGTASAPWFWKHSYEMPDGSIHWALTNPESEAEGKVIDGSLVLQHDHPQWLHRDCPTLPNWQLIARAPALLSAMADEIERLRRGDFTSDEFQNLCHNTKIQDGFEAFADGCEAYQQKMFGRCRTKGKVL